MFLLAFPVSIRGSFAFVIYDSVGHRVLAARDSDAVQPLYWGATGEGERSRPHQGSYLRTFESALMLKMNRL